MIFKLLEIIITNFDFEIAVCSFKDDNNDWVHSLFYFYVFEDKIIFDVLYISLLIRFFF